MATLEISPEINSDRQADRQAEGKSHLYGLELPLCPKITVTAQQHIDDFIYSLSLSLVWLL